MRTMFRVHLTRVVVDSTSLKAISDNVHLSHLTARAVVLTAGIERQIVTTVCCYQPGAPSAIT